MNNCPLWARVRRSAKNMKRLLWVYMENSHRSHLIKLFAVATCYHKNRVNATVFTEILLILLESLSHKVAQIILSFGMFIWMNEREIRPIKFLFVAQLKSKQCLTASIVKTSGLLNCYVAVVLLLLGSNAKIDKNWQELTRIDKNWQE